MLTEKGKRVLEALRARMSEVEEAKRAAAEHWANGRVAELIFECRSPGTDTVDLIVLQAAKPNADEQLRIDMLGRALGADFRHDKIMKEGVPVGGDGPGQPYVLRIPLDWFLDRLNFSDTG